MGFVSYRQNYTAASELHKVCAICYGPLKRAFIQVFARDVRMVCENEQCGWTTLVTPPIFLCQCGFACDAVSDLLAHRVTAHTDVRPSA